MGTIQKLLMTQTLLTSSNEKKTTAPGSAEPDDAKQKQKQALPGANGATDNVMATKMAIHRCARIQRLPIVMQESHYFQEVEMYETVLDP